MQLHTGGLGGDAQESAEPLGRGTTAIQNLGGKMDNFWLAFGDHDIVGILEMPDNIGASAFAMALAAGGAVKSVKTTPLMGLTDAVEAMKKAAKCGYKPISTKRK